MFYPLKFKPVYKDYIWGGRNLEKLGKVLPEGKVAESWELSCHPDGVSIVENGEFEGTSLGDLISEYGAKILGSSLPDKFLEKFPLLIKFIDANDRLSVQVHPEDEYAKLHENGELGKNEMWYIIDAKPGAKLIYGVVPGTTRESFAQAVKEGRIESCLNYIEVKPGDTLNIPAGLVHAIGEGIMLAEVQQNSNTTYRVYDYDRRDKNGSSRPLHIDKALEVINFNTSGEASKAEGLKVDLGDGCSKTYKIANEYFSVELYEADGSIPENADGSRFYIYIFTEGSCELIYGGHTLTAKAGETVLIPAALGPYTLKGKFSALKAYVPDLRENVIFPLQNAGYSSEDIFGKVAGLQ